MVGHTTTAEDLDVLLRTLADEGRRELLRALSVDGAGTDSAPILRESALRDLAVSTVELFHTHLPMLAERGYVHWDEEPLRVTRGPLFTEIEPLLDVLTAFADDRSASPAL